MRRMLVLAIALAAARAEAQPAAALGHPLPSADVDNGEVVIRVIAGSPKSPVVGTDVTLTVNGTARVARTDDDGRAHFKDLPAGAKVQAKIVDEDKKDVTSDEFPVPEKGGMRVMLSTKPMQGGMGGAPFAGGAAGAGGMPEPRQLSGQPRPEPNDPPGTYTLRLTYDDLKEAVPPEGINVALVAYGADDSIHVQYQKTDKGGRVSFPNLDRSGATSYFAMALMPRGSVTDRLMGQPIVMLPQAGVRALLSSQKKDSTAPAIDDLLTPGEPPTAAGKVRVTMDGVPDPKAQVALIDAATHTVIGKVAQTPGPPDPTQISGGAPFEQKADLPAGTLAIDAKGGQATLDPLAHVQVSVVPADAKEMPADAPTAETDASGVARLDKLPAGPHIAVLTINGRQFLTNEFDLATQGGALHVTAQWASTGKPEAVFDYVPRADQVLYAETSMRGQTYRSRPFVGVPEAGTHLVLRIFPRILFAFSLTARNDDQYLNVQGRFQLFNNSWAPYVGDKDGILLPLPKGFLHGILAQDDQMEVAVDNGNGFRVVRPIPPGGRRFIGGFSLPVEDGNVKWDLDLPFGSYQSGIEIQDLPGMSVQAPSSAPLEAAEDKRGKWRVMSPITIMPGQSMVMTISGMPAAPTWTVWVPRILGLTVVAGMLTGLGIALWKRRQMGDATRDTRRQKLLDELVAVEKGERTDKSAKRREQLLEELENLWE